MACTVLTTSPPPLPFKIYPRAPACSVEVTSCSFSEAVNTRIRTFGQSWVMLVIASTPPPGRRRSSRMTLGDSSRAILRASAAVAPSPTTSRPSVFARAWTVPARNNGWSSMTSTRTVGTFADVLALVRRFGIFRLLDYSIFLARPCAYDVPRSDLALSRGSAPSLGNFHYFQSFPSSVFDLYQHL